MMMNDCGDAETRKEVLQEIMGLMSKLGYEKMKKPMAMKVEMMGMDEEKPASEEPMMVEEENDDDLKQRLMSRFKK